jgi:CP family cyanate transporter-like MFS transporter
MENVRTTARPAVWLMFGIILVALNLRPSMAAVGPCCRPYAATLH